MSETTPQTLVSSIPPYVYVDAHGEWWHYDETWAHAEGPFPIKALALKAMWFYCQKLG